jgi:hypothetical protein
VQASARGGSAHLMSRLFCLRFKTSDLSAPSPRQPLGCSQKCGIAPGAPLKVLPPEDSHHHGPERAGKFGLPTFVCFESKAPFDTARSDLPP